MQICTAQVCHPAPGIHRGDGTIISNREPPVVVWVWGERAIAHLEEDDVKDKSVGGDGGGGGRRGRAVWVAEARVTVTTASGTMHH